MVIPLMNLISVLLLIEHSWQKMAGSPLSLVCAKTLPLPNSGCVQTFTIQTETHMGFMWRPYRQILSIDGSWIDRHIKNHIRALANKHTHTHAETNICILPLHIRAQYLQE